jgi:hypothetical protein
MSTLRIASAMAAVAIVALLAPVVAPSAHGQPATPATAADPSTTPAPSERIKELIAKLSDQDLRQRIKAQNELVSIGDLAEPQLLECLNQNPDPETRTLIESILKSIEQSRRYSPTLITLDLDRASPRQAFEALTKQAHWSLAPGAEHVLSTLTQNRVTIRLDRIALWDSVLEINARCGLVLAAMDHQGRILLEMLPSDGAAAAPPAARAGPFLVTINQIETSGNKRVSFAGRRPTIARKDPRVAPPSRLSFFAWHEPRHKMVGWFIDSVDACVTDTGHDMCGGAGRPTAGVEVSGAEISYALAAPDPKAERIAKLALTARFVLAPRTRRLEVPNVGGLKEFTHSVGGFRVVIQNVNKVSDRTYSLALTVYRDHRSARDWAAFQYLMSHYNCFVVDAQGNVLYPNGGGGHVTANQISIQKLVTNAIRNGPLVGEPVKLVWEFPEEVEQLTFPLVFRDVPLP